MLERENIIIFPDVAAKPEDGLPLFQIMQADIKKLSEAAEKAEKPKANKYSRMPKVDMGVPPPKKGEEKQARAGATFDPKHFKGNAMFVQHLNEVAISMLK